MTIARRRNLTRVDARDATALKLGKKTEALYERAVELTRQLDRYAYGTDVRRAPSQRLRARNCPTRSATAPGRYPRSTDHRTYPASNADNGPDDTGPP